MVDRLLLSGLLVASIASIVSVIGGRHGGLGRLTHTPYKCWFRVCTHER